MVFYIIALGVKNVIHTLTGTTAKNVKNVTAVHMMKIYTTIVLSVVNADLWITVVTGKDVLFVYTSFYKYAVLKSMFESPIYM